MDFGESVNRRGTNSVKWDTEADARVLPMWIADMDFKSPQSVVAALRERVRHGVFGYATIPDEFYHAIAEWWRYVHGLTVEKELILPVTGVMSAISAIIRTFTQPGQKILIQPPVYNRFFDVVHDCGRTVIENNLVCVDRAYSMDFEDLENKAADPDTKIFLLCNPHNPVGRSWQREELDRIAEICSRNNVIVVSDEVHGDLVLGRNRHVPFASVARNHDLTTFTLGSPGKTFNLSGLQVAYLFCPDQRMKATIKEELQEASELNAFAVEGLLAAYTEDNYGWTQDLKDYLIDSYAYLKRFCKANMPEIEPANLEATYLVWLDCRRLGRTSKELQSYLLQKEGLWLVAGDTYGRAGEGFLRINIGCQRSTLEQALSRLANACRSLVQP